jgi:DNA-binding NarL/FixJ family response regulator
MEDAQDIKRHLGLRQYQLPIKNVIGRHCVGRLLRDRIEMKILVVDDHTMVREGLKAVLELEKDVDEVHEAKSGMECLAILEKEPIDVVFLDLKMPGLGGIETARSIKERHPEIKIIILTNYDEEEFVQESMRVKVNGYLLKDANQDNLQKVIHMVLNGNVCIDRSIGLCDAPIKYDKQNI